MADAMEARSEITSVMGMPPDCALYLIGPGGKDRALEVPSITGMLVGDVESELWDESLFQLDIWTHDLDEAIALERVIRWLFHQDIETTLGGVRLFIQFMEGRTVTGPGPDNYYGRSLDFMARPARQRFVRAAES